MPRLPFFFVSLPMAALMAAVPLLAAELKTTGSHPSYLADRANEQPTPLAARLEFTAPESVAVIGDSALFQIESRRIDAISYAAASMPAGVPGEQLRLLTIGFFDDTNRHHNAVLQLRADTCGKTLRQLEGHTGIKLGADPRKVLPFNSK